jgi:hypothetical protein
MYILENKGIVHQVGDKNKFISLSTVRENIKIVQLFVNTVTLCSANLLEIQTRLTQSCYFKVLL